MKNVKLKKLIKCLKINQEALIANKENCGIISGKSMEPTLRARWRIKTESLEVNKIAIGDIIIFGKDNITCHRIIGKVEIFNRIYLIHKGDNAFLGGIVNPKDLIGRVVEVFDDKGRKIVKEKWQNYPFKEIEFLPLNYIYFFMFLFKKLIFKEKSNKFIILLKRIFWKLWCRIN